MRSLALTTVMLVAGCHRQHCALPFRNDTLKPAPFHLGDTDFSLPVPDGARAVVVPSTDSRHSEVGIGLAPDYRRNPTLLFSLPGASSTPSAFGQSLGLTSGAVLAYTTRVSSEGMGGPEGILNGRLIFPSGTTLLVSCHDQCEHSVPDPSWCLAYLHRLTVVASSHRSSSSSTPNQEIGPDGAIAPSRSSYHRRRRSIPAFGRQR
jgi:hypothetical protein